MAAAFPFVPWTIRILVKWYVIYSTLRSTLFLSAPLTNYAKQPKDAKYYGFKKLDQCDDFEFEATDDPAANSNSKDYQIEHVLEWQLVTGFFDHLNNELGKDKFDNPEPKKTDKMDFCKFWKATWTGPFEVQFSIDGSESRSPLTHLASAFPGTSNKIEEFVWVQTTLNSPAKSNVSAMLTILSSSI